VNPIKFFLRKLIEYALTERSSPTIWLGWADVSFGGKRAMQLGAPIELNDALRYEHKTLIPTDHYLINAYEKIYEDTVEYSGTNTVFEFIHEASITGLYQHCAKTYVTLRTTGATAEVQFIRRYQATEDIDYDWEIASTTSTTYVGIPIRFDNLRFAASAPPTFRVGFRTTDPAYPWYSGYTGIWVTHARAIK